MTTLVVNTLAGEMSQDFRLALGVRTQIASVLPYLYMHNAPAGTFTVSIEADYGTAASKTFDCDDIKAALNTTDDFAHVFYPVVFDDPVQLDAGTYSLKLSASGYSPTGSSFIGWIQQHEDLNMELDYTPLSDSDNPLAFRLKTYKEK